jgi:sigma-E factor negative regulatory protein RseC
MPRTGYVLSVDSSQATISTKKRGVCDSCSEAGNCGMDTELIKEQPEIVVAENPLGARVGDFVDFDLPDGQELRVSLLIWIVPLIGMVIGVAGGAVLADSLPVSQDLAAVLGAAVGLLAAFGVLRIVDRRAEGDERLTHRVTRVVTPVASCGLRAGIPAGSAEIVELPKRRS